MIEIVKDILGVTGTDLDLYLAVICTVALMWAVKSVITGVFNTVLHIFQQ